MKSSVGVAISYDRGKQKFCLALSGEGTMQYRNCGKKTAKGGRNIFFGFPSASLLFWRGKGARNFSHQRRGEAKKRQGIRQREGKCRKKFLREYIGIGEFFHARRQCRGEGEKEDFKEREGRKKVFVCRRVCKKSFVFSSAEKWRKQRDRNFIATKVLHISAEAR